MKLQRSRRPGRVDATRDRAAGIGFEEIRWTGQDLAWVEDTDFQAGGTGPGLRPVSLGWLAGLGQNLAGESIPCSPAWRFRPACRQRRRGSYRRLAHPRLAAGQATGYLLIPTKLEAALSPS